MGLEWLVFVIKPLDWLVCDSLRMKEQKHHTCTCRKILDYNVSKHYITTLHPTLNHDQEDLFMYASSQEIQQTRTSGIHDLIRGSRSDSRSGFFIGFILELLMQCDFYCVNPIGRRWRKKRTK